MKCSLGRFVFYFVNKMGASTYGYQTFDLHGCANRYLMMTIFHFGITPKILFYLLFLQPPFVGGNRQKIQQKIIKDKIKLPSFLSSEAHSLLRGVSNL